MTPLASDVMGRPMWERRGAAALLDAEGGFVVPAEEPLVDLAHVGAVGDRDHGRAVSTDVDDGDDLPDDYTGVHPVSDLQASRDCPRPASILQSSPCP